MTKVLGKKTLDKSTGASLLPNDMPFFLGFEAAAVDSAGPIWRYAALGTAAWLLYTATVVAYRIIWHPLAKFPGPVLARSSYMYEFWYDVVLQGRYTRKISEFHQKYGK
jgi:hypothetical protein